MRWRKLRTRINDERTRSSLIAYLYYYIYKYVCVDGKGWGWRVVRWVYLNGLSQIRYTLNWCSAHSNLNIVFKSLKHILHSCRRKIPKWTTTTTKNVFIISRQSKSHQGIDGMAGKKKKYIYIKFSLYILLKKREPLLSFRFGWLKMCVSLSLFSFYLFYFWFIQCYLLYMAPTNYEF